MYGLLGLIFKLYKLLKHLNQRQIIAIIAQQAFMINNILGILFLWCFFVKRLRKLSLTRVGGGRGRTKRINAEDTDLTIKRIVCPVIWTNKVVCVGICLWDQHIWALIVKIIVIVRIWWSVAGVIKHGQSDNRSINNITYVISILKMRGYGKLAF